jgi:hypothetical protein
MQRDCITLGRGIPQPGVRMSLKRFLSVGGALLVASIAAVFAACSSGESNNSSGAGACIPGAQTGCDCPGGAKGVQVCQADGHSLGECACGDTTSTGSNTGSSTTGTSTSSSGGILCGNGVADSGECDLNSEFYCPADCGDAGGGDGGNTDAGKCVGQVVYAGMTTNQPSVWQSNGKVGTTAGNDLCSQVAAGSHFCTYEEIEIARQNSEPNFKAIAQGTTAWLHRTTAVKFMYNGQMLTSQPGGGGRCNDWTYATNHAEDGEWVEFQAPGVPSYHFDNDTTPGDIVNGSPASVTAGINECGGVPGGRAIFCCYPCN